ncbi:MAG: hypothetical protein C3F08_03500 [Candidatus Methylomirabilota bacterium]|nr:MAG: hypothetical protein C3F08_03500 [candidate division NC10 bacterium]
MSASVTALAGRLMRAPRLRKLLIWFGAVVAALILFAFFALPPLMKSYLIRTLSDTLHREVAIQQIGINPFTLSVTVGGVTVKDRDTSDTFVSLDRLFINLESLSIFRLALIVKEVHLDRPYIRIVHHQDGSYNFSDLLGTGSSKQGSNAAPRKFSFNNVRIVGGSLDLIDQPKHTNHTVRDLNIAVPFISNYPYYVETSVEPRISATINDSPYLLEGKTKPFASTRQTVFDIEVADLDIPHYLAYIPVKTNFAIRSGKITVKAQLSFVQQPTQALTVDGRVALRQLSLTDAQDRPLLTLPTVDVALAQTEPLAGLFHIASVTLESPELFVRRDPSGTINLQTLFPGNPETPADTKTHETSIPPVVDIDAFQLNKGVLSFSDTATAITSGAENNAEKRPPAEPINLVAQDISVTADTLTTRNDRQGNIALSLRLNKRGTASINGPVSLTPLSAQLAVSLKAIDIRPLQPYFTDWVKINVTKGAVSTNGNLSLSRQAGSGLQAAYKGKLSVAQFGSVDKAHAQDFLAWQSLAFDDLAVGYNPTYVHIGKVALADFYARLIVHPDGSVNLAQIMEKETAPETAASPAASPPVPQPAPTETSAKAGADVQIRTVTLQGGRINFTDASLRPVFNMDLAEIGGRVSGLSSREATLADADLRGKVNQFAPLEITGKINPLRDDLFVDLKARFSDMDLSAMTPYSGKYIGYTIEKGKLSFDLNYQITKRKLDSKNNLFLDQFTLGEKVESPSATNLPVRLAIALLKDRKGEIHLDLPVTGSLDDPQFSVWKVVLQILGNLIAKAATAPFALLGSLIGGGEELGYLEYEPGSAVVTDANATKIEKLAKALYDRPSLKLEIEGHVDMEKDPEGLRQREFMRKLKVQTFNRRLKQGQPSIPVDELNIEPAEYEQYLKLAYKAETFPKPRNILGFAKDLPAPEMEKLMLTHIQITDDALRLLISQRALAVKDAILRSNKVEPERLFIIEPKSLAPEKRDTLKASRVDFRIR